MLRPLELLEAWELGERCHPCQRSLTLLVGSDRDAGWAELLALDVAERDRRLLLLREQTFGSVLACYAECPACAERLEFSVEVAELPCSPESGGGTELDGARV